MTPLFLGLDQVLRLHQSLIERHCGADGVRDLTLLESALAVPRGASRDCVLKQRCFAAPGSLRRMQNAENFRGNSER